MGMFSFKLPDLGEGTVESEISEWYVRPGDVVEEDQAIAEVITDKAMVEISSPVSGVVVSVACAAGEVLAVGSELICFEVEGEGNLAASDAEQPSAPERPDTTDSAEPEHHQEAAVSQPSAALPQAAKAASAARAGALAPSPQVVASPSVRQRARDEQVDLALVTGSGPAGRISHGDLDAFIAAGGQFAAPPVALKRSAVTEIKLKGLRRVIAQKMQQSKQNIPHYSYIEEVDMTHLQSLRQHLNAERADGQPRLTLLPFLIKALQKVLPRFPHCNARYDDETGTLTQYDALHAGIATMTESGLMVPVVKHCEALNLWQTADELARVAQAARDGRATKDELAGSTITISSLGAIGGIATTPIINAPETAIIGVNKLQERPVALNGELVVRTMMNLSCSFDHRIVDGFDGAQLVQALKKVLENPAAIFVEEPLP